MTVLLRPRIAYLVPGALRQHPGGEEEAQRRVHYLRARALSDADVRLVDNPAGPASIESAQQEEAAAAGMLPMVGSVAAASDAIIIGCFGDPGLREARRLSAVPVVGPAQAACHQAAQHGGRFALLTVVADVVPMLRDLIASYGLQSSLCSIAAVDIAVLELRARRCEVVERLAAEARRAVREGADALVLGCMTMGFLEVADDIEAHAGVPVVNPVVAALHLAESWAVRGLARRSAVG